MEDNDILLKLKRLYSKDETVALLTKELRAAQIENGKLRSEIAEAKHILDEFAIKNNGLINKIASKDIHIEQLKNGSALVQKEESIRLLKLRIKKKTNRIRKLEELL